MAARWSSSAADARAPSLPPEPADPARRRPRRLRRILRVGIPLLLVLAVAVLVWLAVTAVQAQRNLTQARAAVTTLRADLLDRGTPPERIAQDISAVRGPADAAARQTGGPLWAVAAQVPYAGRSVRTVRGASAAVRDLADGVLPELAGVQRLLRAGSLHTAAGAVALAPLQQAQAPLSRADARTGLILTAVRRLPTRTFVGAVDRGRSTLLTQLTGLAGQLRASDDAARLLPPMLGAGGERQYLLVFENDAESRGLGGLPGAYAIIRAEHGTLHFTHFGNDSDFDGVTSTVDLGADYRQRYAAFPKTYFVDGDVSPHFPDAARIWLSMWQHKTGQQLDGVIATDPQALAGMLAVTGPAKLPDGSTVDAGNVVALTEQTAYARYPDTTARKAFLLAVAKTVADTVVAKGPTADTRLAKALATSIGERRLVVYSAHPAEQALLSGQPIGGLLSTRGQPYAQLVVNNAAGSKLDYYLDRELTYQLAPCRVNGRAGTITATLTNDAPPGLPDYVVSRADGGGQGEPRGTNRLLVSFYGAVGAELTGAQLNGRPTTLIVEQEQDHPVWTADVQIRPGQSVTFTVHTLEPTWTGPAAIIAQPLVRPEVIHDRVPVC